MVLQVHLAVLSPPPSSPPPSPPPVSELQRVAANASSAYTNKPSVYSTGNLIDGDNSTEFFSLDQPETWVEIDLGSELFVDYVVIHVQVDMHLALPRLSTHSVRIGMTSGAPENATTVCVKDVTNLIATDFDNTEGCGTPCVRSITEECVGGRWSIRVDPE